jgi:hypothetical protein
LAFKILEGKFVDGDIIIVDVDQTGKEFTFSHPKRRAKA